MKSFIKDIRPSKSRRTNKIDFIKAGQKPPTNKQLISGILHLASDWILLADIDNDFIFPAQIALTQLRPDVVIFSKALKRVIIIELTCPCEENMSSWHASKLSKYSCLVEIIRGNNWHVDLFAIEVGARGYPSNTLSICLKRLGFHKSLLRSTIIALRKIAIESSFFIWLSRNSNVWTAPNLSAESNKEQPTPNSKTTSRPVAKNFNKVSTPPKAKVVEKHAGFVNKGNTCYANSILQILSTIPSFWCQGSSESGTISPLAKAVSQNLSLLKKRSSAIDPSNFLIALQNLVSKKNNHPFNVNTQHDVPEILQFILDELKGTSIIADNVISASISCTETCQVCFLDNKEEIKYDIIRLDLSNSIRSSLELFFSPKYFIGENRSFCNMCSSLQDSERTITISNCGYILIFQLIRYVDSNGKIIKDNRKVDIFSENLTIPVKVDDSITINKAFKLKATINHSGTLDAGHYWAFIKDHITNSWLKCNDQSVLRVNFSALSNDTSYILVYASC